MSRQSNDEMVTVSCGIERETERAWLIVTEDHNEHWIPKSQSKKTAGGLKIKQWLVDKNDILVGHHAMLQDERPRDLDPPLMDDDDIPF